MKIQNEKNNNADPNGHEVELPVPERKNDVITANKKENADWQENKINESFNEDTGAGALVDEKGEARTGVHRGLRKEAEVSGINKKRGELGDTRRDSIIDRPRTETYEEDYSDVSMHLYKERDEEEEKW